MITSEDLLDIREKSDQKNAPLQAFHSLVASEFARVRRKLVGDGVELEYQGITLFHVLSSGVERGHTITLVMDVHHATKRPARYTLSYTHDAIEENGNIVVLDSGYDDEDNKKLLRAKSSPLMESLPLINKFLDKANQQASGTYGGTRERHIRIVFNTPFVDVNLTRIPR